jgi:hypothetical protein
MYLQPTARFFAAVAALALCACTADGNDNLSTVELQLASSGPMPAGADTLSLVVRSVAVHVGDSGAEALAADDFGSDADGRWHTLSVERAVTFPNSGIALGSLKLPAGAITQIRLNLGSAAGLVAPQGGCTLDLTPYATTGWRLSLPFKPFATYHGVSHVGLLALDLSATLIPTGNCFGLQPTLGVASWLSSGHPISVN